MISLMLLIFQRIFGLKICNHKNDYITSSAKNTYILVEEADKMALV